MVSEKAFLLCFLTSQRLFTIGKKKEVYGSVGELIHLLPWYLTSLNVSCIQLRKNQTLERLYEFLKQENEIGLKTFQLLEMIHKIVDHGLLPGGMIIANNVDIQRYNLFVHQTKRMCNANLMVTNQEAQNFPRCHHNKDSLLRQIAQSIGEECTRGLEQHGALQQVQIIMRGVALLKVGGKLFCSTCSMNPIEYEAVVGEILRRSRGSMELLNVSIELPQLKHHLGLKNWKVQDRGHCLTSYSQVHRHRKEDYRKAEIDMETILINDSKEKDGEGKGVQMKWFFGDMIVDGCIGQLSDVGNLVIDTVETLLEDTEDKDVEAEEEVARAMLDKWEEAAKDLHLVL
eukprot:Gb_08130 [translate_table: standard]